MGARPEDYAISAPYKSYIHVDDFEGPKELAEYLHKLDQDDQLYNEYFKWKVFLDLFFPSGYHLKKEHMHYLHEYVWIYI